MVVIKALIAFTVFCGFIGIGAFLVGEGIDLVDDIGLDWDRGGGCHGDYYRDSYESDDDWEYHCRDLYDAESEDYCPHFDEYLDEGSWEDHWDECPFNEE